VQTFKVGDVVVNLTSTIARVVAIHSNGDPILRSVRVAAGELRTWGGKWIADPAKTRGLTAAELQQFANGGTEIIR
jgi:hypothetical protein